MALSDEEQKLLEQMEAALAAEDPKLAHAMRGTRTPRTLRRKRAALSGVAFLIGCGMLVAGMRLHWLVSVLGFVVMLASTIIAISAYRRQEQSTAKKGGGTPTKAQSVDSSFMDKMEERWRRRQDDGL
ncbi:DUF3040 domain-containing protein [Enemella evansiae]|uniref:DUF3040 domain-containing protein n=1 Tax=Enemella evansiae TaxID=2016499 RepID=A0A255GFU1_9ACTN|nr:DUF3040 domain-containing protein [Enemella evansiae]PFG67922.1 Protein of unknown function (DUF3040) [Propionibacteriaceae bacterium ES.041]OYN93085.1 hypothetical protein CGZ95_20785 [Enemella evansiae]OYN95870.1 hypothetical protein CGZ96_15390 [Enemella evansiae]OYO04079.1 hypothetical protein CGZ97_11920 [Enemella evansiae]OYO08585.1 hypothetical protein BI335_20060 [Enemella evansiae]